MCAGDDQIVASAQNEMTQRLGHREVEQLAVQNGLHSRVATRHGISDHDQICRGDVIRLESLSDGNSLGLQEGGHRRIHIVILTSHPESFVFHRGRDGAHRCAADAEKVHMLRSLVHFFNEVSFFRVGEQKCMRTTIFMIITATPAITIGRGGSLDRDFLINILSVALFLFQGVYIFLRLIRSHPAVTLCDSV